MPKPLPRGTYDKATADRAVRFIRALKHGDGKWAGKPFNLSEWQEHNIVRPLFGTLDSNGFRQYREAFCALPRKNGKSELAAAIGLYLLIADGEPGAQVVGSANDKKQAKLVFDVMTKMRKRNLLLMEELQEYKSSARLVYAATDSYYEVLSKGADSKHGLNIHGAINDELHVHQTREVYDVIKTGTSARQQPLIFSISTAGVDKLTICGEVWDYALSVASGVIDDPTFMPIIYAADPDGDWQDPEQWKKANPALGDFKSYEYMEMMVRSCKSKPAMINTFKRLDLNIWTGAASRWIPQDEWNRCRGPKEGIPDLTGRPCYAGLDLAKTTDLAAMALLFPPIGDEGTWYTLPFFWMPGADLAAKEDKDVAPYRMWVEHGFITATPGNVIDYDFIVQDIVEMSKKYDIRSIGCDPYNATQVINELSNDYDLKVYEVRQGYFSLSEPTKELERMVLSERLIHGGNPVLDWMANNAMAIQDAAGNIKLDKSKSRYKIDGMAALVNAVRMSLAEDDGSSSYLNTNEMLIL